MDPFVFVIVVVAIVCGSIVSLIKSSRERSAKYGTSMSEEDARIMQDIHRSLTKMEKRVEALETIIINKK